MFELNPLAYVVGLTRLVLARIPEPGSNWATPLNVRPENSGQNDLTLCSHLPVAVSGGRTDSFDGIYDHFRFPARDSETLFLQHASGISAAQVEKQLLRYLEEGILFRSGSAGHVRQSSARNSVSTELFPYQPGTFALYEH